jgi:hypothetical protein
VPALGDPALHFKGKTIRVAGIVTLMDNRPQIEVDAPGQIEVGQGLRPDTTLAMGPGYFSGSWSMTTGVFAWMLCRRPFAM